ncbi:hypothetical protein EDC30_104255 [Paucimonas lemoignei]|uniref:Uncharacterized protein n=1 Tax=Paucimonas lemoignei TaxID=29443 RepID=A0A4R3HYQ7_PAULE|nr:hypothetical protein [Paucimonas lemoignei]TCS37451.1 hypothetical protein EDC30_104255 [Paucimonas lemoignei]
MRERPILFSAPMVRAILDGTKLQTRRAIVLPHENALGQWEPTTIGGGGIYDNKGQKVAHQGAIWHTRTGDVIGCPHGSPGDRLYVREAWRSTAELDKLSGSGIAAACLNAGYAAPWAPIQYEADGNQRDWMTVGTPIYLAGPPKAGRYRHARFMPRWASRINIEITSVRVERLQGISNADAIAEGIRRIRDGFERFHPCPTDIRFEGLTRNPVLAYRGLWEQINGAGSWDVNPWVWVIEFKRIF